jgi:hypothetical protein
MFGVYFHIGDFNHNEDFYYQGTCPPPDVGSTMEMLINRATGVDIVKYNIVEKKLVTTNATGQGQVFPCYRVLVQEVRG